MKRLLVTTLAVCLLSACQWFPLPAGAPPATSAAGSGPAADPAQDLVIEGQMLAPASLASAAGYRASSFRMAPVPGGTVVPLPKGYAYAFGDLNARLKIAQARASKAAALVDFIKTRLNPLGAPVADVGAFKPDYSGLPANPTGPQLAAAYAGLPELLAKVQAAAPDDLDEEVARWAGSISGPIADELRNLVGRIRQVQVSSKYMKKVMPGVAAPMTPNEIRFAREIMETGISYFRRDYKVLYKEELEGFAARAQTRFDPIVKEAATQRAEAVGFQNLVIAAWSLVASASVMPDGRYKVVLASTVTPLKRVLPLHPDIVLAEVRSAYRSGWDLSTLEAATAYWAKSPIPAGFEVSPDVSPLEYVKLRCLRMISGAKSVDLYGSIPVLEVAKYRTADASPGRAFLMTIADGSRQANITPGTTFGVVAFGSANVTDLDALERIASKADAAMTEAEARDAATGGLDTVIEALLARDPELKGMVEKAVAQAPAFPDPPLAALPSPTPAPPVVAGAVWLEASHTRLHLPGTGEGADLEPSATTVTAEVVMTDGATHSAVTWLSSDPTIAAVDATGHVTAGSKPGTAIITATSSDGQATGSVEIAVASGGLVELEVR